MSSQPAADYRGMQQPPLGVAALNNSSGPGADTATDKKRKSDGEEVKVEADNGNELDLKKQKVIDGSPEDVSAKLDVKTEIATPDGKEDVKKEGVKEEEEEEDASPADIFQNPHSSRTFLCTVSLNKNEVKWVGIDATHVATVMQSRNAKGPTVEPEVMDGGASQMYPTSPYHHPMMHPSMGGRYGNGNSPSDGSFPSNAT